MLSEKNVDTINDQIEKLLRDLRFTSIESSRQKIFNDINALQALLNPQPSTEEIVAETLKSLANTCKPKLTRSEPTISDLMCRLFDR